MVNQCTVSGPLMISVPSGQIIHIRCPIHPEGHDIRGSSTVSM